VDPSDLATASRQFVLHSLRRDRCVIFTRGDNARLWDADGREYLDTMSGSAGPAMVGHANTAFIQQTVHGGAAVRA
jgi:4-aminobutyrate aminotransferase-like enzyme